MKKIPTIFERNPENMRELQLKPNEKCRWVFEGEGEATVKYDGTCCMIKDGEFFKRREVKNGKPAPDGFILGGEDKNTGKKFGWIVVSKTSPDDKWHREAFNGDLPDGTYELLGEKVQGNPEGIAGYFLQSHKEALVLDDVPRDFYGIQSYLKDKDIEGIVFHHEDGRMGKIKKCDFGMKRK